MRSKRGEKLKSDSKKLKKDGNRAGHMEMKSQINLPDEVEALEISGTRSITHLISLNSASAAESAFSFFANQKTLFPLVSSSPTAKPSSPSFHDASHTPITSVSLLIFPLALTCLILVQISESGSPAIKHSAYFLKIAHLTAAMFISLPLNIHSFLAFHTPSTKLPKKFRKLNLSSFGRRVLTSNGGKNVTGVGALSPKFSASSFSEITGIMFKIFFLFFAPHSAQPSSLVKASAQRSPVLLLVPLASIHPFHHPQLPSYPYPITPLELCHRRHVKDSDLPKLTYLQACVKETLRLHPVGPLLLPHRAIESCTSTFGPLEETLVCGKMRLCSNQRANDSEYFPFGSRRRMCPNTKRTLRVSAKLPNAFQLAISLIKNPHVKFIKQKSNRKELVRVSQRLFILTNSFIHLGFKRTLLPRAPSSSAATGTNSSMPDPLFSATLLGL
ncbi:hypothetical protein F8388_021075 [Cannabis sativa]|uniref:Cytochrome P450 n=1 Tax=Cannabis sativa TaxID=3483 RepID=A0A7J6GZG9_CANSA|nr:hypothetical protein F8388_021075 [Cannabis sativa]